MNRLNDEEGKEEEDADGVAGGQEQIRFRIKQLNAEFDRLRILERQRLRHLQRCLQKGSYDRRRDSSHVPHCTIRGSGEPDQLRQHLKVLEERLQILLQRRATENHQGPQSEGEAAHQQLLNPKPCRTGSRLYELEEDLKRERQLRAQIEREMGTQLEVNITVTIIASRLRSLL